MVTVRPATVADTPAMGRLHVRAWQAAYRGQMPDGYLDALEASERAAGWERALGRERPRGAVLVAERAGEVVGFAALSPYKERPAYRTSVEDSVYVHRDHQGRGVGRLLLGALLDTAGASGFHAVFARIVGGHEASIRLHASFGFETIGTEREVGRKFGKWLDVVVMERLLV